MPSTRMEMIRLRLWCLGLDLFDAAAILNHRFPGQGLAVQRDRHLRDQERKWRQYVGRFVSGWQPGLKDKYFRRRVKGPLLPPQ